MSWVIQMWMAMIALCDNLRASLGTLGMWCGLYGGSCRVVTQNGMVRTPLFEHTAYHPETHKRTVTLSHAERPDPRIQACPQSTLLDARFESLTHDQKRAPRVLDVTDHMNARLASFTSGSLDAPSTQDYLRYVTHGKPLGLWRWDAPVIRLWARSQWCRSSDSDVVLRVTTMDLQEVEFKSHELILL